MRRLRSFLLFAAAAASLATLTSCSLSSRALAGDGSRPWTDEERAGWYWGTQGSRLIPAAWFMALEQAGSTNFFADEAHLTGFGYIAAPPGRAQRLPIGFAIDRQPDEDFEVTKLRWYRGQRGDTAARAEPWIGMNCAACHTAEIVDGTTRIRIDGGPGLGDFDAFVTALDSALIATRRDQGKWERFAARVLGPARRDTPENRDLLAKAMDRLIDWQKRTEELNRPGGDRPDRLVGRAGFARVDAFGHIYNKVQLFAGAPAPTPNAADAPVSYPFLWNIHRQKKVQWNGVAENSRVAIAGRSLEYGALGRNAGEVLGVFGEAVVRPASTTGQRFRGFRTSVNVDNLDRLEALIPRLRPPAWPEDRHPIRRELLSDGRDIFNRDCVGCHKTPDRWRDGEPIEVMVPFKSTRPENLTDIWMACNAYAFDGPTGKLQGTRDGFVSGNALGPRAPLVTLLTTTVKGALVGRKGEVVGVALANFSGSKRPPIVFQGDEDADAKSVRRSICLSRDDALLAYKARPLDGIWATAPYLHNGSVPTLHDLLLPASQRPTSFRLGTRAYDFDKVGYRPMTSGGTRFLVNDDQNRPVAGNSNAGHEYGVANLSPADRRALLEYLKTL